MQWNVLKIKTWGRSSFRNDPLSFLLTSRSIPNGNTRFALHICRSIYLSYFLCVTFPIRYRLLWSSGINLFSCFDKKNACLLQFSCWYLIKETAIVELWILLVLLTNICAASALHLFYGQRCLAILEIHTKRNSWVRTGWGKSFVF